MPMSCIEDDLMALFSSDDFGEECGAIRNGVGDPIPGIFDDEDVEQQNGEGAVILVPQVSFCCSSSKVPDLRESEVFTIRETDYVLRFWQDDGVGLATLYFERPD